MPPSAFNSLGMGTTQLHSEPVVYNRRRHGRFELDGRVYDFRMRTSPARAERLLAPVLERAWRAQAMLLPETDDRDYQGALQPGRNWADNGLSDSGR